MKYLFQPENMRFLEALAFTDTLYAFDFDGTLAKIVEFPDEAGMTPKTQQALSDLAKEVSVSVISGRGLQDLRKRVKSRDVVLIGNHGIEGFDVKGENLKSIADTCRVWRSKLLKTWIAKSRDPYIELEDKEYSLSLHYRRSRQKKRARDLALQAIAELNPKPRIIYGKCVINVMPADSPHKGNAILKLLNKYRIKKVFYIGDDDTDEFVFGMDDVKVFSVRVGQSRNSKAMFYIKNQSEINKLLGSLIRVISSPRKAQGGLNYERRYSPR